MRLEDSPTWIKGLKIDTEENLIQVWSSHKLNFYSMPQFLLKYSYTDINGPLDQLNDILYIPKYRYFVICTKEAVLSVYKMVDQKELII